MKLEYTLINNEFHNVKEVLKAKFQISDRLLAILKRNHKIFLNGEPCYITKTIIPNDNICVDLDFNEKNDNIESTKMNLEVLLEDEALIIINKPAGIPVHPSQSHYEDSLSNRIKILFPRYQSKKKN